MAKQPLRCHQCGQTFARVSGAGRFHSQECKQTSVDAHSRAHSELVKAGWVQGDIPNSWVKGGYTISHQEGRSCWT